MHRGNIWKFGLGLLALLGVVAAFEIYAKFRFYQDLREGRDILRQLEDRVDLQQLNMSEEDAKATLADFKAAERRFESAQSHLARDPLLNVTKLVPFVGRQVKGLEVLVDLGKDSSAVGYEATGVLLEFSTFEGEPEETALQSGLAFLESQAPTIEDVDRGLRALLVRRSDLPGGLIGPLNSAAESFDKATAKLVQLVDGYNKAYSTLPDLLGRNGRRTFLVLPQNDAELLPSGGLISSYAIATFNDARLESIELEYFGTLFDRWQKESGGEYIEPPAPLKNYLKKDFSWGLGEAGWFPDFPTTAKLARMFAAKGGAPETDGVIALDQQFVQGLLTLLGSVEVPAYDVVITSENLVEKTLELTRDDQYEAGTPKKAFLSHLSQALLDQVFAVPKEEWVSLLNLFDEMAKQRHLQIHFEDPALQALMVEYGFDGAIVETDGDYVMLADASVNSTKLDMVLEAQAFLEVQLNPDGTATTTLKYEIHNPFDEWRQGRDPELVRKLMLEGVYGSYSRVYTPLGSRLLDVSLNGQTVGIEQIDDELGKRTFGRFFPTLPGETNILAVTYRTPVVFEAGADVVSYQLYIQKEAGMAAVPLTLRIRLPAGSQLISAWLDGELVESLDVLFTDLATDRVLEVRFSLAPNSS